MKYLIINADDFGMSPNFNEAISKLLLSGSLSTTSLMPNGLYYDEALDLIRKYDLQNIGIHLTLTRDNFIIDEPLIYNSLSNQRSSINNPNGLLYTNALDLKTNATCRDIIEEIKKQILKIQNEGIKFTHIDNHMYSLMPRMGINGYFCVFSALASLDIKRAVGIRIANDFYNFPDINYIWSGRKLKLLLSLCMKALHLKGVDYSFAFPYYAPNQKSLEAKEELLHQFLSSVKEGVTELHVHPCTYSKELETQNPTWENRVHEYEMLKRINKDYLKEKYGIRLITYKDIIKNK